jgi:uncharacterized protein (DUF4415 family)
MSAENPTQSRADAGRPRAHRAARRQLSARRLPERLGSGPGDEEVEAAAAGDPDAPPLDEAFWQEARVVFPRPVRKKQTGLRIDEDVLAWFRAHGPGYQSRINAVLRAYVEARKRGAR